MITKEAVSKNKYTTNIYFSSSARICFEHLLKHLDFADGKKILLPSYIGETDKEGSGVFDPVRKTKTKFDFYKITSDLSIDKLDFESKIRSGEFKVVLIIHYFGFIQKEIEWIIDLCKSCQVLLIEDCAHTIDSYFNGRKVGSFGDFSFFSIHKLIATDDGGYLQINNNNLDIPYLEFIDQNIRPETIEQFYKTKMPEISEIRRNNYKIYLKLLTGNTIDFEIMYPELPEGIIPLNFPILLQNGKRERVYFKLLEKEVVTCSLYYRLIHEIEQNRFPLSHQISSGILNLPVHQDTTEDDIEQIVCKLDESIKEI